jgi:hypothetical protein
MFDAKAEFFSERSLNRRLDLQQIPKGSPEAITTLFKREKYTHLVVADTEMLDGNFGSVSVQVAKLSEDGSTTEWDMTPDTLLNPTESDRDLYTVLLNFQKFRAPDAPKRVNVLCIAARLCSAARRRDGDMAACGARAAVGDAGGRRRTRS